jgi:hypothetical protein
MAYYGSPDVYFQGMGVYGMKITCVNCNSEIKVLPIESMAGVHHVCPICHEYADEKAKPHKITCKHCFAGNHFNDGEDMSHCRKCGKSFSEEIDKNRKCDMNVMFLTGHNSIIPQRYL